MTDNNTGLTILSSEEHLKQAEFAEQNMDYEQMILHLNLALKNATDKTPILEKMLEYYMNDSNPSRALKVLKNLIDLNPYSSIYYKQTINILSEIGKQDKAIRLSEIAFEKTKDYYFKEMFKSSLEKIETKDISISDNIIIMLLDLFSGREGVYARQWKNSEGHCGYMPVNEHLNEKVVRNHLLGNISVGIYQLRMDSTVNWLCFDVDIQKSIIKEAFTDDDLLKRVMLDVKNTAVKIYNECAKYSIDAYMEFSGYKGYHVWVFFDKPIVARMVKKFANQLILNIIPEKNTVIEVFPKQNFVKSDGYGNLVKLPLGVHIFNSKRSYFVNSKGKQIGNIEEFLKSVKKCSQDKIVDFFNLNDNPFIEVDNKIEKSISVQKIINTYSIDLDKEFQYLIFKCPVLKEIYNNAFKKNELSYEESLVIAHTVGHLENGVEAVNTIFSKCFNISADKYLKSRFKGNPVSCAKIRKKLPEITSHLDCNCQFDLSDGLYPTPTAHLNSMKMESKVNFDASLMGLQNSLEEYLKLKKQVFEIQSVLKKYEEEFENLFKTSGVDKVQTPLGEFRRTVDEHGKIIFKLDV
jgi:hypothetical protein